MPDGRPIMSDYDLQGHHRNQSDRNAAPQSIDDLDRVQRIAGIGSTTEQLVDWRVHHGRQAPRQYLASIRHPTNPRSSTCASFITRTTATRSSEAAEEARLRALRRSRSNTESFVPDGRCATVYRENAVENDARDIPSVGSSPSRTSLRSRRTKPGCGGRDGPSGSRAEDRRHRQHWTMDLATGPLFTGRLEPARSSAIDPASMWNRPSDYSPPFRPSG